MEKMLIFKDANNVAYMNSSSNFRGCNHDIDDKLSVYFQAAAVGSDAAAVLNYDKIILSISDEGEIDAMKAIAIAVQGGSLPSLVVADDIASTYIDDTITAVDSITLSTTGTYRPVEAITNAAAVTRTLTVAESGKLFTVDMSTVGNNVAITLPLATTAGTAGVYYDFCFLVNSDDDADFSITTGADAVDIFGTIDCLAAVSTNQVFNGLSKITVDASVSSVESIEGMRFSLLCDGANWHISGHIETAVAVAHLVGAASA